MSIDLLSKLPEPLAQFIGGFLAKFNLDNPNWDVFLVGFLLISGFLYGLSLGRNRLVLIFVSIYISKAVVAAFPFGDFISELKIGDAFVIKLSLFLAIVGLVFALLSKSALRYAFISARYDEADWFQVLIFSAIQVGFILSELFAFMPDRLLSTLTPVIRDAFITEKSKFVWTLLPVVAMLIFKPRPRD